jgi:outer membrane protein OmpA-like peptidoglycan-associated protein
MKRVVLLATFLAGATSCLTITRSAGATDQKTIDQMINALRPTASTSESIKRNPSSGLRGIGPAGLSANPPVAPRSGQSAPTSSPTAQNKAKGLSSINLNVQFRTNSAELTPEAVHILDDLGRALSSETLAPYRFQIVGHTDAPGSADLNKVLSQRRAQAVVDYIVTKYGVSPERLDAFGVGSEDPLVPTSKSEWHNRRVQIVNVGG